MADTSRIGKKCPPRTEEWKQSCRSLSVGKIKEFRRLFDEGWTQKELAARFHIGQTTASRIVRGESYKGVGV